MPCVILSVLQYYYCLDNVTTTTTREPARQVEIGGNMDNYQLQPAALPTIGQRTALRLLQLAGWRVRFKPLPGPHGVAVVYPHTSNWDFIVGLLAKWAIGLPFRWLGKESLFRGAFGRVMRSWGGMPVERGASTGATRRLADTMNAEAPIVLAPPRAGEERSARA
jgi:hypothetical protein